MLDLFSGCGGMSLGFVRAGCESLGGVEVDADAARSFARNLHPGSEVHARARDIRSSDPIALLAELGHEQGDVDLIVGGPPCPAFTRVGRAKLREVHDHPEAFLRDPRARLYESYLRFVAALEPLAVVMENVPDILNWGGRNLGEEIGELLGSLGYESRYTLLNAVHYGVPQARERFFLVALHKDLGRCFEFPSPLRAFILPRGYDSSRTVALRTLTTLDTESSFYVPTPGQEGRLPAAVTVAEAIGDLPPVDINADEYRKRGPRYPDQETDYQAVPRLSPFVKDMRAWPGFHSNGRISGQVTRCLTDRDHRIFAAMEPEDEYPQAIAKAESLLAREMARRRLGERSAAYGELRSEFVPPYDVTKYPNKWWKMAATRPARTLMAHLGKDSYSHIHYEQPRVLTIREAARLQSFPDGFAFCGRMNSAFRQIGNAVPPLLAFALAQSLVRQLRAKRQAPIRPQAKSRQLALFREET